MTLSRFGVARLAVSISLAAALHAQSDLASITGVVTDSHEAVIPGAVVGARNTGTNIVHSMQTGEDGYYTLPNLPPGPYELTVSKPGFTVHRLSGIVLETGQVLRHDALLQVGSVSETVNVTAQIAVLNTENGAIKGDVIVQKEIEDLPLNGRDFTDLAFMVPGVMPKAQGGQGSAMAINGARADSTNFNVDGFDDRNSRGAAAQYRPNIDAIQEFKMEVGGFSPEYGRMAGGNMSMALKSGANRFHGTLFEYFRNDVFDSRAYFDTERLPLRQNQFGGTIDGPVLLPRYNGHDRTFFLLSMESFRFINGQTRIGNVPTALERGGDFSRSLSNAGKQIQVRNPYAKNAPFPGDVIPAGLFNPVALNLLAYYPLPNRANLQNNFLATANSISNWDSFLAKVDHRFSDNDTLSILFGKRFGRSNAPWAGSDLGEFQNWIQDNRCLGGITYTHLFTPTLINEFRVGFSRNASVEHTIGGGVDTAARIGMQGSTADPLLEGLPHINVTGLLALGYAANEPVQYFVTEYQAGDKLTWIRGKHVFKFGVDLFRTLFNQPFFNNSRGTMTANGIWTGGGTAINGDAFGDLLLGLLNTSTITQDITRNYLRYDAYGGFVNDDFKVTRSLTLNLGMRYEIDLPPHDKYERLLNFVPALNKIVIANSGTVPNFDPLVAQAGLTGRVALAKDYGIPSSLVYGNYRNFAPRLGFAWRPFGADRWVLRGGYGIFYTGSIVNDVRLGLGTAFPFSTNLQYNRLASDPTLLTLATPWPQARATLAGTNTSTGYQLHAPTGYLQSYNLTVERQLNASTVLEVAYVGSKGTHLGRQYNINMPFRSIGAYQANVAFPVPYASLSTINYWDFGSNSIYNAGQVTLRKRGAGGSLLSLNYMYSKSIDNASQQSGQSDGGFAQALDARNLGLERARSDWDRGHVVTAAFSWQVPAGHGHRLFGHAGRVLDGALGGWQFSGTAQAATGPPFTVEDSNANAAIGESIRPNRRSKGYETSGAGRRGVDYPWFDPTAFVPVPGCASRQDCSPDPYGFLPFAPGNSGRGILDGPGLFYVNTSLMKNFAVGEARRLQFRFEVFNILNRPNFQLPDRNYNEVAAGIIDGVQESGRGGPRVMQFALKYYF